MKIKSLSFILLASLAVNVGYTNEQQSNRDHAMFPNPQLEAMDTSEENESSELDSRRRGRPDENDDLALQQPLAKKSCSVGTNSAETSGSGRRRGPDGDLSSEQRPSKKQRPEEGTPGVVGEPEQISTPSEAEGIDLLNVGSTTPLTRSKNPTVLFSIQDMFIAYPVSPGLILRYLTVKEHGLLCGISKTFYKAVMKYRDQLLSDVRLHLNNYSSDHKIWGRYQYNNDPWALLGDRGMYSGGTLTVEGGQTRYPGVAETILKKYLDKKTNYLFAPTGSVVSVMLRRTMEEYLRIQTSEQKSSGSNVVTRSSAEFLTTSGKNGAKTERPKQLFKLVKGVDFPEKGISEDLLPQIVALMPFDTIFFKNTRVSVHYESMKAGIAEAIKANHGPNIHFMGINSEEQVDANTLVGSFNRDNRDEITRYCKHSRENLSVILALTGKIEERSQTTNLGRFILYSEQLVSLKSLTIIDVYAESIDKERTSDLGAMLSPYRKWSLSSLNFVFPKASTYSIHIPSDTLLYDCTVVFQDRHYVKQPPLSMADYVQQWILGMNDMSNVYYTSLHKQCLDFYTNIIIDEETSEKERADEKALAKLQFSKLAIPYLSNLIDRKEKEREKEIAIAKQNELYRSRGWFDSGPHPLNYPNQSSSEQTGKEITDLCGNVIKYCNDVFDDPSVSDDKRVEAVLLLSSLHFIPGEFSELPSVIFSDKMIKFLEEFPYDTLDENNKATAEWMIANLMMYEFGRLKPNYAKAFEVFTNVVSQGDQVPITQRYLAKFWLAAIYRLGLGLEQPDYPKAWELYKSVVKFQSKYRANPSKKSKLYGMHGLYTPYICNQAKYDALSDIYRTAFGMLQMALDCPEKYEIDRLFKFIHSAELNGSSRHILMKNYTSCISNSRFESVDRDFLNTCDKNHLSSLGYERYYYDFIKGVIRVMPRFSLKIPGKPHVPGNPHEGIELFESILKVADENRLPRHLIVNTCIRLGDAYSNYYEHPQIKVIDLDKAIISYERALEHLSPLYEDYSTVQIRLGNAYCRNFRLDGENRLKAFEAFTNIIDHSSNHFAKAYAHYKLGEMHYFAHTSHEELNSKSKAQFHLGMIFKDPYKNLSWEGYFENRLNARFYLLELKKRNASTKEEKDNLIEEYKNLLRVPKLSSLLGALVNKSILELINSCEEPTKVMS